MRKIRVAQIGIGHAHAGELWKVVNRRRDLFDVVGYVVPEDDILFREKDIADYEGGTQLTLSQVLEDDSIEAVLIETDERILSKYAILAAKAGKHIHMDKPGGMDVQEFETLISLLKEKDLVFSTGYMYRYNPQILRLLEDVKKGELGQIVSVEAQMDIYHKTDVRQKLSHMPGGNMFFLGCHMVDLVMLLQGVPEKVYPFNKPTGLDNVTTPDCCMAILEYPNSFSYVRAVNTAWGAFTRRSLTVTGTKKTVEIKPLEKYIPTTKDIFAARTDYDINKISADQTTERSELFRRYDGMMEQFVKYVCGDAKNPITYDYELNLHKTVLRCCGEKIETT